MNVRELSRIVVSGLYMVRMRWFSEQHLDAIAMARPRARDLASRRFVYIGLLSGYHSQDMSDAYSSSNVIFPCDFKTRNEIGLHLLKVIT